MEIEKWTYENVNANGTVAIGGSVYTEFNVRSSIENSCTIDECKCRRCHWISVNLGMQDDACVYGMTYYFKTEKQLSSFILGS